MGRRRGAELGVMWRLRFAATTKPCRLRDAASISTGDAIRLAAPARHFVTNGHRDRAHRPPESKEDIDNEKERVLGLRGRGISGILLAHGRPISRRWAPRRRPRP